MPPARVAEFLGGPADGHVVVLLETAHDGAIQTVVAPFKLPDGRPTYAVYRLTHGSLGPTPVWRFTHVGVTDENVPLVERVSVCSACAHEVLAIMPEACEPPLQCPACKRMTVWPKSK